MTLPGIVHMEAVSLICNGNCVRFSYVCRLSQVAANWKGWYSKLIFLITSSRGSTKVTILSKCFGKTNVIATLIDFLIIFWRFSLSLRQTLTLNTFDFCEAVVRISTNLHTEKVLKALSSLCFGSICLQRWPPGLRFIVWRISVFSSATTTRISTTLYRKQVLNALYQIWFFFWPILNK